MYVLVKGGLCVGKLLFVVISNCLNKIIVRARNPQRWSERRQKILEYLPRACRWKETLQERLERQIILDTLMAQSNGSAVYREVLRVSAELNPVQSPLTTKITVI